jgi:hypothetical protein
MLVILGRLALEVVIDIVDVETLEPLKHLWP